MNKTGPQTVNLLVADTRDARAETHPSAGGVRKETNARTGLHTGDNHCES